MALAFHVRHAALTLLVLLSATAARGQGGAMEVFEEVDPYTGNDPEKMSAMGYVRYGPFPWRAEDGTVDVQVLLGDPSMLWVETEHFRIGSSLVTYSLPNDKDERSRIKEEIGRLEQKLGRIRAPRKELDPWLRLHLYAQRAEEAYQWFLADFGLEQDDFEEQSPHLGQHQKFLLLLCERRSEFGRYVRTRFGQDVEGSFHWGWQEGGMVFVADMEELRSRWPQDDGEQRPYDTMFFCWVLNGLASNFVNGYHGNCYGAPLWMSIALGHRWVRRVDPRWVTTGRDGPRRDEEWMWDGRAKDLIRNELFASFEKMTGWFDYGELNDRDHIVIWSKLDWFLEEAEGDHAAFLAAVCQARQFGEDHEALIGPRQVAALEKHFGLTPAAFDEAWEAWGKRTYRGR